MIFQYPGEEREIPGASPLYETLTCVSSTPAANQLGEAVQEGAVAAFQAHTGEPSAVVLSG